MATPEMKPWRRLTLAQMALLLLLPLLLAIAARLLYIFALVPPAEARSVEAERATASMRTAYHLESRLLEAALLLERYQKLRDEAVLAQHESARRRVLELADRLEALRSDPLLVAELDRLQQLLSALPELRARWLEGAGDPAAAAAMQQMQEEARMLVRRIADIEGASLQSVAAEHGRVRRAFVRHTLIYTGLLLMLAVATAWLLARMISRNIHPFVLAADQMAAGRPGGTVPERGPDELARLARAFNRMTRELGGLDRSKDAFVALASHQLRTPATATKGNLAMLLDGYFGPLSETQREAVRDAYAANEQQLHIIEDLLSVAQVESGRMVLSMAETDLAALVLDVAGQHRTAIEARGQQLGVSGCSSPLWARVDRAKMSMVIDNLLSNASKYTPQGGRITLALETRGRDLMLAVQDNGVGIATEDRDKLFRKFSRIDNPLSAEAGGSGLGLYLAQEIAKLHGGRIEVESFPGQGSLFRLRLPDRRIEPATA